VIIKTPLPTLKPWSKSLKIMTPLVATTTSNLFIELLGYLPKLDPTIAKLQTHCSVKAIHNSNMVWTEIKASQFCVVKDGTSWVCVCMNLPQASITLRTSRIVKSKLQQHSKTLRKLIWTTDKWIHSSSI
jgi:hypothetical protein